MDLTTPILLASAGTASVVNPKRRLDIPRIGPLIVSGTPYLKSSHRVIRGTNKPAPKAIIELVKTYLNKTDLLFLGRRPPTLLVLMFDSLTFKSKMVDARLRNPKSR